MKKLRIWSIVFLFPAIAAFAQSSGPTHVTMMYDTASNIIYPKAAQRYVTNNPALDRLDFRITGLSNDVSEFKGNVDAGFSNVYDELSNVSNSIVTNAKAISDLEERHAEDVGDLRDDITLLEDWCQSNSDDIDDIQTNAIPDILDQLGVTVYGALNADGEYIEYTNARALQFDKDSGFTVQSGGTNDSLLVSLGSAWTVLHPDILLTNDQGEVVGPFKPSGEEQLRVSVTTGVSRTGTFWGDGATNKNEKTFFIGLGSDLVDNIDYNHVYVTDDITVRGIPYPIGQYSNGSQITNGTPLRSVFLKMFTKAIPPTYTAPKLSVSSVKVPANMTYEYGTSFVGVVVTNSFTQNDAGGVISHTYATNTTIVATHDTTNVVDSCSFEPFNAISTVTFSSSVSYEQGPVKQDSEGHDYEQGRIPAGTISSSFSIYVSRYLWYDTKTVPVFVETNTAVKALSSKGFVSNNKNLTIALPRGTRQTIIAIPGNFTLTYAHLKTEFTDMSVLSDLEMHTVDNVTCINTYSGNEDGGLTYKVYSYTSPSGTESDSDQFIARIQ